MPHLESSPGNTGKPCLISLKPTEALPDHLLGASQAAFVMQDSYNVVEIKRGSSEHLHLERMWPGINACSFLVVEAAGFYWLSKFQTEKSCLEFLSSPDDFGTWVVCPEMYSFVSSRKGVANDRENHGKNSLYPHTTSLSTAPQKGDIKESSRKESCILSVRLMEGGCVTNRFNPTDCLKDVKRWLQQELNLSLIPEENITISRYTNIGHFEPSRYAFFCPATRRTFSEAQEFVKLKDLDLCPRSALILRPDYDESAMKAAREAEDNRFKKLINNTTQILQALYSFFDYGVDDASEPGEEVPVCYSNGLEPPQFLKAIGSTPSASLIDVRETSRSVLSQMKDYKNLDTSSQANGENLINVGREEF